MLKVSHSPLPRKKSFVAAILSQVGWPLLWGMAAWVGFYALILQGVITNENLRRYFAGHPVEFIEAALFFVGLAALGLKLFQVAGQHFSLAKINLPAPPPGGNQVEDCPQLLATLKALPERVQESYLARRLREALGYVDRKGSADDLDEQLRFLSDVDAAKAHDSFALVRLVIWAVPILGFLGTVIGITMAISNLAPESIKESTAALTASLSVAFDTTTVALGLSIVLMFAQFLIVRIETELLTAVDERTSHELVGRFEQLGTGNDPQLAFVRKMADSVIRSCDQLVNRQAQLWKETIDAARDQWSQVNSAATEDIRKGLHAAISDGLTTHADHLAAAAASATERSDNILARLEKSISAYNESIERQHAEMTRQGDIMHRAIEASGEVSKLQQALNDNLESLAGANNFEDTVMSLAAAIHLLNTRLATRPDSTRVELDSPSTDAQGRAA